MTFSAPDLYSITSRCSCFSLYCSKVVITSNVHILNVAGSRDFFLRRWMSAENLDQGRKFLLHHWRTLLWTGANWSLHVEQHRKASVLHRARMQALCTLKIFNLGFIYSFSSSVQLKPELQSVCSLWSSIMRHMSPNQEPPYCEVTGLLLKLLS